MVYQPFYYSPSASPVSTPCRMSFIPRPRLVPKSFNVTDCPSQPTSVFADAISIPFAGILTLPPNPKERKAAEAEAQRLQVEAELKANGGKPDQAEKERVAITELCRALNVEMKEVSSDVIVQSSRCNDLRHVPSQYIDRLHPMVTGECVCIPWIEQIADADVAIFCSSSSSSFFSFTSLYAAVADQLNLQKKGGHGNLTYHDTRKTTAQFMRSHAKDFMPFISDSDEHMAGIENKEAGSQEESAASKQEGEWLIPWHWR